MPYIVRITDDLIDFDNGETYRVQANHVGRINYWNAGEGVDIHKGGYLVNLNKQQSANADRVGAGFRPQPSPASPDSETTNKTGIGCFAALGRLIKLTFIAILLLAAAILLIVLHAQYRESSSTASDSPQAPEPATPQPSVTRLEPIPGLKPKSTPSKDSYHGILDEEYRMFPNRRP